MKIKKLWLAVLTLVLVYAMGTFAYADEIYDENGMRAYGDESKIYIELPTGTSSRVEAGYIDKVIEKCIEYKGIVEGVTEVEIVILGNNYGNVDDGEQSYTTGQIQEGAISSAYKGYITSVYVKGNLAIPFPKLVYECKNLKSVVIDDTTTITQINDSAFSGCTGLESIVIPKGVETIGANAFSDCTGLKSVVISEGVITIGANAFSGCESLESIVIPEGVTSIGKNAFSNCESLESIVIPESVTSIGQGAFLYCKNLTEIVSYSSGITKDSVVGINNFFDSDYDGYLFYDEDEGDYIDYYEEDEAEEILAEAITIKEITVPETSSDGTSENSTSENSSYDRQVGILIDNIEVYDNYATFDVKIDTSHYGGEDGVYLDAVYVIFNDISNGTTADEERQIKECYEEDGYVIFPVELKGSNVASVAVRGEVYAGSGFKNNNGPYYYASTAKYMSSYVNEETA
jgi:hypothetical protein